MEAVADPDLDALFDALDAHLDATVAHGIAPLDGPDAYRVVRRLEAIARKVRAAQADLLADIDTRGLHTADGHRTAKALVAHAANLSTVEATRRAGAARVLRTMPTIAAGYRSGRIGTCNLERLVQVHANPRVRDRLEAADADLAVVARHLPHRQFSTYLTNWERLADEDGARTRAERAHHNRTFRPRRNLDGTITFDGGCGTLQGTAIIDIHDAYVRAELAADWADARHRLGDTATVADLARTDAQRSMDALEAMTKDAAHGLAERTGHQTTTNLVLDHTTFERHLARLTGNDPGPDPRLTTWWNDLATPYQDPRPSDEDQSYSDSDSDSDSDGDENENENGDDGSLVGYRCSTLDGHPLDPTEATLAALLGHIRRTVTTSAGVIIDMGRRQRLFTGPRHLAVMLNTTHCPWPGCTTPNHHSQADHLQPWSQGGRTNPGNGAPGCGKHNRHRNGGFTVHRDPHTGTYRVQRPDGTWID